jgi:hypothetical protein
MSVTMSDEQYGTIMRAMSFIAGNRVVLADCRAHDVSKSWMREVAREVCIEMSWPYCGDGSAFKGFDATQWPMVPNRWGK